MDSAQRPCSRSGGDGSSLQGLLLTSQGQGGEGAVLPRVPKEGSWPLWVHQMALAALGAH